MTLFIAILIIAFHDGSGWWIFLAIIIYCVDKLFQLGAARNIYQRFDRVLQLLHRQL